MAILKNWFIPEAKEWLCTEDFRGIHISLKCLDGHARDLYERLDAQFPDGNQHGIGTNLPPVFSLIESNLLAQFPVSLSPLYLFFFQTII